VGKNDGVVERTASDQSHGAKRINIPFKAKCAGLSQQGAERLRLHRHLNLLGADQRVGEVHVTLDVKFVSRIDADAAIGLDDFHRPKDLQIAAAAAKLANSSGGQQPQERFGGAVQDGDFDRVDVNKDVVEPVGIEGRQEMFSG